MYRSLAPGALGVEVDSLKEGLDLAARHGFAGYHYDISEAAELGVEKVEKLAASAGVRLAAWGFPLAFRGGEGEYEESSQSSSR